MLRKLTDIDAFILAENLSNKIWRIVHGWKYFEKHTIGMQLVRAIDSVSANIAESHGGFHYRDKQKFGYYARGSLEETKSWVRKCYQRKLISDDQMKEIIEDINIIGPKLNKLINTFKLPHHQP
jgi:four helix bundle protein